MTIYLILSTIAFFLLAIVWTQKTWFNTGLKIVFAALFVFGLVLSLAQFGYVVKV